MQKKRRNGRASTETSVEDEIAHLRRILKSYAHYYNGVWTSSMP